MPEPMYIHSKCCTAHWELVYRGGNWELECEGCGKPAGGGISVIGPNLGKVTCDCCKEGGSSENHKTDDGGQRKL